MIIFEKNLRQNLFKPKRTKLKDFYQFPPGACLRTPQVNLQKSYCPPPLPNLGYVPVSEPSFHIQKK